MIRLPSAVLALALVLPLPASAQDDVRARARENFTQGVARYEARDYQGALEAFQEAYRLSPHPTVRVNIANCYERLERPLEALHHFERYLVEAQRPTLRQRREVAAAVRRLQRRIGQLSLTVTPDGALVTIDSAETRRAPIDEPVRLAVGTHQIEVRHDGFRTDRREVRVQGGQTERVRIQLERGSDQPAVAVAEPTPPPPEPTPTPEPQHVEPTPLPPPATTEIRAARRPAAPPSSGFQFRLTTPVIVAGSATIALAVAAIISGSVAVAANNDFESAVVRSNDASLTASERDAARNAGLSAADTANTSSILTDVFLIGAIGAAGVTTFFVIVDGMNGEPAASEQASLRAAPSIGRDGGGIVLTGFF